jgi:mannose-6-phosphate isomerase-like protein (cupin superfamily)
MSVIMKPAEKHEAIEAHGDGWAVRRIAGRQLFGGAAMAAFHWSLEAHVSGPQFAHGEYDEMFYVITGGGTAVIGGHRLPLEAESLIWLEPGDSGYFEAGEQGLQILQAYAPGA